MINDNYDENASLYLLFGQVMKCHRQRIRILLERFGVYPGQQSLFFCISHEDGLSQKELSEKLNVTPATVAIMVGRMEKAGMITRKHNEKDGRIWNIYITDKGKEIHNKIKNTMITMSKECFDGFSKEEEIVLKKLLLHMHENLKIS